MRCVQIVATVLALSAAGGAWGVTLGPGSTLDPPFAGTGFRFDQVEAVQTSTFSREYVRDDGKIVTVLYGGFFSMAARDTGTGRVTLAYQYFMPVGPPAPDSNHVWITQPLTYAAELSIPGFAGTALDVHIGVDPDGMGSFFPNTIRRSVDGDIVTLGPAIPYAGEGVPGVSEQVIVESPSTAWEIRTGKLSLLDEVGTRREFDVQAAAPVPVPEAAWLGTGAVALGFSRVWRRLHRGPERGPAGVQPG